MEIENENILFIGLDQSINSTGLTLQIYKNDTRIIEDFYIISGSKKLTKKEQLAQDTYNNFNYVLYGKLETKNASSANEIEQFKTINIINITNNLFDIIKSYVKKYKVKNIYCCMEGVSYGSSQTKSLIELSGLNFVIRYLFNEFIKQYEGFLYIAPPGEIKKFATGNGNSSKDVMINIFKAAYKNLSLVPKIDDIADSYWMCAYIKKIYDTGNRRISIE